MRAAPEDHAGAAALGEVNRRFYDALWRGGALTPPDRFGTWALLTEVSAGAPRRLEVGPGLRPRTAIPGTHFVDLSAPALSALSARGGRGARADLTAVPFADACFDLVVAMDVLEHVQRDDLALAELARVLRPGGTLLLSTPLFEALWTEFDRVVGHCRRYEPDLLVRLLRDHGFSIERSAVIGMQPRSRLLARLGAWWLQHRAEQALWWYERVLPLAVRFDSAPRLRPGLIDTTCVDEVLVVCRKRGG